MSGRFSRRVARRFARGCLLFSFLATFGACAGRVNGEEVSRLDEAVKVDGGVAMDDDAPPLRPSGGKKKPSGSGKSAADMCRTLAGEAEAILEQRCASCHGPGKAQGGFSDVLDVERMIAQGKIVPKDALGSRLFMLVNSGVMPRGGAKLEDDEIDTLDAWITCGATDWNAPAGGGGGSIAFLDINKRLSLMYDDLRSIENPTDRQRIRYLDLSVLANAGATEEEIDAYRQTLSFMVNSLSKGRRVAATEAIDDDQLLFRIDLRTYGWSAATWETIVAEYPYAVRYDADSRIFPYDEDLAESIREETETQIPYVDGDWFMAHASLAPLYYDILEIPSNVADFAREFGVDIAQNVRDTQVARAGFNSSGVSVNNRVIERHEQPGFGGAVWISYDFAASDGDKNIFANPTDFRQDAGEGFLNLPNGLQAYFIQDGQFRRVDKADPAVVTDPNSRDRAVSPGLSCLGGCHLQKGILVKDDQVRAHVQSSGADAVTREDTFALYPPIDDMRALMDADAERYLDAVAATGFALNDDNIINIQVRKHQDLLHANEVAAVLGISESEFVDALDASPQTFPAEVTALRLTGGTIYRDTLDRLFSQIVRGLGLGESISSRRVSSSRGSNSSGSSSSSASGGSNTGSASNTAGTGGSNTSTGTGSASTGTSTGSASTGASTGTGTASTGSSTGTGTASTGSSTGTGTASTGSSTGTSNTSGTASSSNTSSGSRR